MMRNAPTSDSGMAAMGMSTERTEPKDRKITSVTIKSASSSVMTTSLMELFT